MSSLHLNGILDYYNLISVRNISETGIFVTVVSTIIFKINLTASEKLY